MYCTGHAARTVKVRNACVLVGGSQWKRPLGRLGVTREDVIKIDLKGTGFMCLSTGSSGGLL
jgi:hypothetical protein